MAFITNLNNESIQSFSSLSSTFNDEYDISPYSPLKRRLRFSDLQVVVLPNGAKAYSLQQSAGIALWWTLDNIRDDIVAAAISPIINDPVYPAPFRSYVPDGLFSNIGMPRPEVLKAVEVDSFNPLYLLTSIPNIVAFWTQLQQIGLAGLAWIREAKARCRLMGPDCGWNWDFLLTQQVDVPKYTTTRTPDITDENALGLYFDHSESPARNNSPASDYSDNDGDSIMDNSLLYSPTTSQIPSAEGKELVLHPEWSHYKIVHPDYDVFSRATLVDNGYVDAQYDMDTSDDNDSVASDTSSLASISTCHSFGSAFAESGVDYHLPLPIVVDSFEASGSGTINTAEFTATGLAEFMMPALRSDLIDA